MAEASAPAAETSTSKPAKPLGSIFTAGNLSEDKAEKKLAVEKDRSPVPASDKSNSASPDKDQDGEKAKKDKTPESDKKKSDDKKSDDKKSDKKGDDKSPEKKDAPADDSKASDQKADDPVEKRIKDTRDYATRVGEENNRLKNALAETNKQVDILRKQLADPNYDVAEDPAYRGPSPEEIADASVIAGKTATSRTLAIREHGEEKVLASLTQFKELFGKNPTIMGIVRDADSPVHEVMHILDRYAFEQKYGDTPAKIKESIRKETEAELRKSIRAEIIAEIREGKDMKESTAKGLSDARKGNGLEQASIKGSKPRKPLGQIFTIK